MLPFLVGRVSIHQAPCDSTQQHPRTVQAVGGTFLSYRHKIWAIASYQEQYPNSTIVVASRTKMQYADAHAFVSGDADYASLEILNELKHCYILVLERAAIEKAIGAKIETQEEYETLSTPFYITLYGKAAGVLATAESLIAL